MLVVEGGCGGIVVVGVGDGGEDEVGYSVDE